MSAIPLPRLATSAARAVLALSAGIFCMSVAPAIVQADDAGHFDLGIDVTGAGEPATPAGVQAFMASIPPETAFVLISTCRHYLQTPNSTRWVGTLPFCRLAVTVPYNPRTYATTRPPPLAGSPLEYNSGNPGYSVGGGDGF
jgi:hypothetical protein